MRPHRDDPPPIPRFPAGCLRPTYSTIHSHAPVRQDSRYVCVSSRAPVLLLIHNNHKRLQDARRMRARRRVYAAPTLPPPHAQLAKKMCIRPHAAHITCRRAWPTRFGSSRTCYAFRTRCLCIKCISAIFKRGVYQIFLAQKIQDWVNALIPILSSHVLHSVSHGGILSSAGAYSSLPDWLGESRFHRAILTVSTPASHRAALLPLRPSAEQLQYRPRVIVP